MLHLLAAFEGSGKSAEELGEELERSGMGLGAFKGLVTDAVSEGLKGVRGEFERIVKDEGYLKEVARRGAERARESAEETMKVVRGAVGL